MQGSINMETYRVSSKSVQHYKTVFSQNGNGLDIDRYIYNQQGAGIGSFFAKLFRSVLPVAKTVVNTVGRIAKPHLQEIGTQLVREGTRVAGNKIEELGKATTKRIKKRKLDSLIKGSHNE